MTFAVLPRRALTLALAAIVAIATHTALTGPADASAKFRRWVNDFEGVARRNGIRRSTYRAAFAGVTAPDPEVLELARYQPEFRQQLWQYFDTRVDEDAVTTGQEMRRQYASWLTRIERKYGVDRDVLLAIWSMETRYGAALKKGSATRNIVRSLATLAYADRRRRKFARNQLIAALKILQQGRMKASELQGSWAGAMGHTQFIPTSYRLYAQDIDGGRPADIWNSVPDALATAANLLRKNGWRTGETWGYEVTVPAAMRGQAGQSRTAGAWAKRGVRRASGKAFPNAAQKAVLKFPAGKNGPAFLMTRNFFVIKRYNNSDKYALAVGHLADRIGGYRGFFKPVPRPYAKLTLDERIELQSLLARMGLYGKDIDGRIGSGTRAAIRKAQIKLGLNPDGFESPALLKQLRRRS